MSANVQTATLASSLDAKLPETQLTTKTEPVSAKASFSAAFDFGQLAEPAGTVAAGDHDSVIGHTAGESASNNDLGLLAWIETSSEAGLSEANPSFSGADVSGSARRNDSESFMSHLNRSRIAHWRLRRYNRQHGCRREARRKAYGSRHSQSACRR